MSVPRKGLSPETRALLDARYGKPNRFGEIIFAALLALVALPWLISTAWQHANPDISVSTVKYSTIDDRRISLTFDLARNDPSTPVNCTLIALDIDRNVVGEVDLPVPPSDRAESRITADIATRLRAVAASVERCAKSSDAPRNSGK